MKAYSLQASAIPWFLMGKRAYAVRFPLGTAATIWISPFAPSRKSALYSASYGDDESLIAGDVVASYFVNDGAAATTG
jgi:hypothetical protein